MDDYSTQSFPKKTADEFTTAIKLSAIYKSLGLRFTEVKYILKRKKKLRPSEFCVSIRLTARGLGDLGDNGSFVLKESFSIGALILQSPGTF